MFLGARVVVVVPACDEAPRIGRVVATMPSFVDAIVVVDDASRDDTVACARASGDPRVEVLRHASNRGVGAAIASGYRHALAQGGAPGDAFAVMAGDAQMHPDDLSAVVTPALSGAADYVKGNRFAWPGVARQMPWLRLGVGYVLSRLTARATRLPITDSQCGYTAIRRDACARLDLGGLWPRFGYPNDLLGQLAVRGMRVAEVPVRPLYAGETSRLRPRHVVTIVGLVARAYARRRAAGG
jgi:glycosyltransferase involved in cell wall biosynthesis